MDKFKFDEKERGNIHGIVPREGELYDWQVDNVIDAIETLISSRADGWVKVEDGVPENDDLVLMAHHEYEWVCAGHYDGENWYNQFEVKECDPECYPTHWQPLAQPPKTAQQ